jgi:hypothetical protein
MEHYNRKQNRRKFIQHGEEHHCDKNATVFTYGSPEKSSPYGITQGG